MSLYIIRSDKLLKPIAYNNEEDEYEIPSLSSYSRVIRPFKVEYTFLASSFVTYHPTGDKDATYTITAKNDSEDVWMENATLKDFTDIPKSIRSRLALHASITLDYEVPSDEL